MKIKKECALDQFKFHVQFFFPKKAWSMLQSSCFRYGLEWALASFYRAWNRSKTSSESGKLRRIEEITRPNLSFVKMEGEGKKQP
ncbi:hypothetical protein [Maribellus sp. YY47]|uniref:hypothetical protein n=1 Tax=Maribellus sp. YY47 TaxID=2929486 RepID=UPI002000AE4E|nr:hypothetical protein [Maribellus sp. YY47]MCK3682570.1 hypothetical protein [Maribellus sp. YY47]